jgi:hypothetical protein
VHRFAHPAGPVIPSEAKQSGNRQEAWIAWALAHLVNDLQPPEQFAAVAALHFEPQILPMQLGLEGVGSKEYR